MLRMSLEQIEFDDIDQFCRSGVREGILLDFKKEIPNRFEKTVSAFANTYGGTALIGVDENERGEPLVPICGIFLRPGLREQVLRICLDGIHPPVIPEVRVVPFKSNPSLAAPDRAVVVVRVHESDTDAHAIEKRTKVYFRTDNVSSLFRRASIEEIEWFSKKREASLREKQRLIGDAQRRAQHFLVKLRHRKELPTSYPAGRFVFWTVPTYPRHPIATPPDLLRFCPENGVGLPTPTVSLPPGRPRPVTDGVLFEDWDSHYTYTEVNQQGLAYHEYGFWWEERGKKDWVLSYWVAQLLVAGIEYGARIYEEFGYQGLVDFHFRLAGVYDRKLGNPGHLGFDRFHAMDDIIEVQHREPAFSLKRQNLDISRKLFREIAWSFGWNASDNDLSLEFREIRL